MTYAIPYDTSDFVSSTIDEVFKTFAEALVLVVLVVFLFLQSWRATLIPIIAVPISLIGTFAGLYIFGFSINLLTLFAMILAIGIVVDDAIVVLENTERLMKEEGLDPLPAAIKSIGQVSAAVIAIVLVLCAVFVPVAFQGGIAGQLYRQFAITIAISVVISGVVALTLTPALCALILKKSHENESTFFRKFNQGFSRLTKFYTGIVDITLHHRIIGAIAFGSFILAMVLLFRIVPGSLVPSEDQGYIITVVVMPDNATLSRTTEATERIRATVAQDPAVASEFAINGFELFTGANKTNAATMFVRMKDWKQRSDSADDMVGKVTGIGMQQPDGMGFAVNPPAIRGLGSAGGFEVYVQSQRDADPIKLAQVMNHFMEAMAQDPALAGLNSFFRPTVPQLKIEVDEAKAISLNVNVQDIYTTLQSTMGQFYVNDFNKNGRTYRVQLQAEPEFRMQPEDLGRVYVRSQPTIDRPAGNMIPLSALSTVQNVVGAEQLERYNGLLSAKVFGGGALGVSSGDAIKAVERIAKENLPDGYKIAWTGQAYQEKRTGNAAMIAFGFAIVMVFLILAAQFETWALPLAVIMAVPFALTGALLAVLFRGMPNDIYFQIGMITLIGLAAKNAILIVEFASQKMEEGMPVAQAALEAARLRFRPIIMTSMAFVLGIVPLVIATGAGAAARQSMGTGVFGGMILATFIATIFIPLFFTWLTNTNHVRHHGHIETEEKSKR
jgi:multidrug efflux pump